MIARESLDCVGEVVPTLVNKIVEAGIAQGLTTPCEPHLFADLTIHAIQKSFRSMADHIEEAVRLSGTAWSYTETERVFLAMVVKSVAAGAGMISDTLGEHAHENLKAMGQTNEG